MNKAQIKAELRRSAREDEWPAKQINKDAYPIPPKFRTWDENIFNLDFNDQRTFFLLVAEAL